MCVFAHEELGRFRFWHGETCHVLITYEAAKLHRGP